MAQSGTAAIYTSVTLEHFTAAGVMELAGMLRHLSPLLNALTHLVIKVNSAYHTRVAIREDEELETLACHDLWRPRLAVHSYRPDFWQGEEAGIVTNVL
jgi:hypothetical protein